MFVIPRTRLVGLLLIAIVAGCATFPSSTHAQVADDIRAMELSQLVFHPTAGTVERGQYALDVRAWGNGGLLAGIGVGVFPRFMIGISYGGERLLGYDDFVGNDLPGVQVRYRLLEETMSLPALTIGFDMQGQGPYSTGDERYLYKAPGAFAVLSRNFSSSMGRFGIHAGANFNTIEAGEERLWDGWAGVDFSLNEQLLICVEYDLALDDNEEDGRYGEGPYGYLNAGIRLAFAQSLALQVDLVDLLNSSAETEGLGRSLKVVYVERFNL